MLANADADENFLKNRLAYSRIFLFPTLKTILKGHHFEDIEEIKDNVTRQIRAIKMHSRKHYKTGRYVGNVLLLVDGTTLKG